MRYPVQHPDEWEEYDRLPLAQRIGVVWREARHRFHSRKIGHDGTLRATKPGRTALTASDIPLLLCVRNSRHYLPLFLSHYRGIGVTRFLVVDDRSDDGTGDFLAEQPDVDLHVSRLTYATSQRAAVWRDTLMRTYGLDRWYLIVDVDEFLAYPGYGGRPVAALIADLERAGRRRGMAPMLDLYPDGPLSTARIEDASGIAGISPMIDGDGYTARQRKYGTSIVGGTRSRLYGNEISLTKFPLIRADAKSRYVGGSIHRPLPYLRNYGAPCAVLLHLKFTAGSVAEFAEFVRRGEHFGGARFYKEIVESDGFSAEADLRYEYSLAWGSAERLTNAGFMKDFGRNARPRS